MSEKKEDVTPEEEKKNKKRHNIYLIYGTDIRIEAYPNKFSVNRALNQVGAEKAKYIIHGMIRDTKTVTTVSI